MNSNDFFYKRDGIENRRRAATKEVSLSGDHPPEQDFSIFGGYQRTDADTGFVPTASSLSVLPQALQMVQGARTKENLFAAFSALNPGILTSIPKAQCTRSWPIRPALRTSPSPS